MPTWSWPLLTDNVVVIPLNVEIEPRIVGPVITGV